MDFHITRSWRSTVFSRDHIHFEVLVKHSYNISPITHVLRLFLHPNDFRIIVRFQCFENLIFWKGMQLLYPKDGHIIDFFFLPGISKVIINLARAKNNACNLFSVHFIIQNQLSEPTCLKFLNRRNYFWMSQKGLGRHDHTWLSELPG